MPKLERWEEKAIGRINRFENYTGQLLTNRAYEGTRAGINSLVKGAMGVGRWVTNRLANPTKPQVIAGKTFTEKNLSFKQKLIRKAGISVANKAIDSTEKAADTFLTRKYFFPKPDAAANALFGGHITLDPELGRQMYNACGYAPNLEGILQYLHRTASDIEHGFSDITWRQDVVPHLLRTAFHEELDACWHTIQTSHLEHADLHSRQLMEAQMRVAAQHLGQIFEQFSLALANKTDYLEAPLTFFSQKTAIPGGVDLKPEERELLAAVPRVSLFADENDLAKQIAADEKKLPKLTAKDSWERFAKALAKPLTTSDGGERLYQKGIDPVEDERRLIFSAMNLRELKQQYETRNFFSRWLTRAGREERKTIQNMQQLMSATLDLEPEQMTTLLDLNTPLEQHVDLAQAMKIVFQEKPEKTFMQNVSEVMESTNEVIRDVTGATLDVAGKVLTSVGNVIYDPNEALNNVGEAIYNTASNIGTAVSSGVNSAKAIMDEGIFGNDLTITDADLGLGDDLFGDMFDRDIRPAPAKPEPAPQENLEQNDPKPEQKAESKPEKVQEPSVEAEVPKQEAPKPEERKPEEPEVEQPQQESTGSWFWNAASYMTSAVTSSASYAASWFDLRNYSIFGGGYKADPQQLQQVQNKQRDVANAYKDIKGLSFDEYKDVFATLIFYKTVEISMNNGMITASMLPSALSEENVKLGIDQIKNDPAFAKLDKIQYKKGIAKETMAYLAKVSQDPSAVNEIHKDYMQKKKDYLAAPSAPKPKESLPKVTEKTHSSGPKTRDM